MTEGGPRFFERLFVPLLFTGTVVAVLAWLWGYDAPPPGILEDLAVAAGLRPPASPVSLHWQLIAGPLCRTFGLPAAKLVLRIAGPVSLGLFTALAYVMFDWALPAVFKRGEGVALWWRTVVRVVAAQGVLLLGFSDPVWSAFRWFSPDALHLLEAEVAALLVFVYFRTARRAPLFAAFALLGLLASDTPFGAVMVGVVAGLLGFFGLLRSAGLIPDLENPLANLRTAWWSTLLLCVGLAAGVGLSAWVFAAADGLEAFGWTWGKYALEAPIAYMRQAFGMASVGGVLVFVGVVLVPALTSVAIIQRAMHDEKPLAYIHGLVFAVCGLVTFSQLAGAKVLWFWTWGQTSDGIVRDAGLRCLGVYLCALTAMWALAVFTFELYLRNSRRLAFKFFPEAAEVDEGAAAIERMRRVQRGLRMCFAVEPLLALACAVPFRVQRAEREMLGVVADAARETARECRDVGWLFTDGGLDAAVELAAAEAGGRLVALSMMGGDREERDVWLRTRGVEDAEERSVLEIGAADALRTWVREHPEKAESYAVQIGFELWQRDGRPMPRFSGLVARPAGLEPGEAERGAEAARALVGRVLEIYGKWKADEISDRALRDAFIFVQWRLAVMASHRANVYDEAGKRELALEETRLAGELDKRNKALEQARAIMSLAGRRRLERMTPRERLRLGLARADFRSARIFAQRVLEVSPDDAEANFAVGMDFFVQGQYVRAETYLRHCLVERPDDPAVLNNLAQCILRQGDFRGALPFAQKALEVLPDSPEVKRTMERITAGLQSKSEQ